MPVTKTQYYTATSIDGYIADQRNSLDWLFEVEDPTAGEGGPTGFADFFAGVGAFCMGATTYEWMVAHPEIVRWQETYGEVPCWVFTHRDLPVIPGLAVTFVAGEVPPVHAVMTEAAAGKNIWLVGGGELAGRFADQSLLDELILGVAPVTLGGGAPLLPRRIPASRLSLTSMERTGPFATLTYAVSPAR